MELPSKESQEKGGKKIGKSSKSPRKVSVEGVKWISFQFTPKGNTVKNTLIRRSMIKQRIKNLPKRSYHSIRYSREYYLEKVLNNNNQDLSSELMDIEKGNTKKNNHEQISKDTYGDKQEKAAVKIQKTFKMFLTKKKFNERKYLKGESVKRFLESATREIFISEKYFLKSMTEFKIYVYSPIKDYFSEKLSKKELSYFEKLVKFQEMSSEIHQKLMELSDLKSSGTSYGIIGESFCLMKKYKGIFLSWYKAYPEFCVAWKKIRSRSEDFLKLENSLGSRVRNIACKPLGRLGGTLRLLKKILDNLRYDEPGFEELLCAYDVVISIMKGINKYKEYEALRKLKKQLTKGSNDSQWFSSMFTKFSNKIVIKEEGDIGSLKEEKLFVLFSNFLLIGKKIGKKKYEIERKVQLRFAKLYICENSKNKVKLKRMIRIVTPEDDIIFSVWRRKNIFVNEIFTQIVNSRINNHPLRVFKNFKNQRYCDCFIICRV